MSLNCFSPTDRATPIPKELTENDVRELTNDLQTVSEWYLLGIKLGVKPHNLEKIEGNHPGDSERCKADMLACWILSCTTPCTWEAVAQALDKMEKHKVAEEIRKKHISSTTTIEGNCFQKYDVLLDLISQANCNLFIS